LLSALSTPVPGGPTDRIKSDWKTRDRLVKDSRRTASALVS
jgi:hypothetical protein